jgi:hypothetical protein
MCPPRRNLSPPFAAHPIDHYDFNVFHKTDREYAVFTTAAVHSLEHRPVKYSLGLPKIDVVFCEVRLPLAFIPLECIPAPSLDGFQVYVRFVQTQSGWSNPFPTPMRTP